MNEDHAQQKFEYNMDDLYKPSMLIIKSSNPMCKLRPIRYNPVALSFMQMQQATFFNLSLPELLRKLGVSSVIKAHYYYTY